MTPPPSQEPPRDREPPEPPIRRPADNGGDGESESGGWWTAGRAPARGAWHRPTPLSIPALDRPGGALRFPLSPEELSALARMALEEDGAFNDVTTIATVVSARRARGAIVARRAGTIAGVTLALETFRQMDPKAVTRV